MILLLLLLPFASAHKALNDSDHLFISIKPGPTEADTTIDFRGTDSKPLSDQEKDTFNITNDSLKEAVETLSHIKPTDIFIRDIPNDLYNTNNWHEFKRDFKIKSIKIVNVTAEVEKQSEKEYTNNETEMVTIKAYASEDHYTFYSTHSWSGNVEVSATVRYELVRPARNEPLPYSYDSVVGGDEFSSGVNIINYGYTAARFDLNPGQSAKFIISARTIETNVKVEYETTLTGDVVVRYADGYKRKQFWAYDVNELLHALNVSTAVETHEFVKITYIKDYPVKVVDVATGKDIPYTDLVTPDYLEEAWVQRWLPFD